MKAPSATFPALGHILVEAEVIITILLITTVHCLHGFCKILSGVKFASPITVLESVHNPETQQGSTVKLPVEESPKTDAECSEGGCAR